MPDILPEHVEKAKKQAADFCRKKNLRHLADEMESAAMLGLLRASREEGVIDFGGYAYTASHREMLQALRRQRRWSAPAPADIHDAAREAAEVRGPETRALGAQILAALLRLTVRHRRVIELHYYREASGKEIEAAMGIHKTQAFRIRQAAERALRKELTPRWRRVA